jgi:hypothetical protein
MMLRLYIALTQAGVSADKAEALVRALDKEIDRRIEDRQNRQMNTLHSATPLPISASSS